MSVCSGLSEVCEDDRRIEKEEIKCIRKLKEKNGGSDMAEKWW